MLKNKPISILMVIGFVTPGCGTFANTKRLDLQHVEITCAKNLIKREIYPLGTLTSSSSVDLIIKKYKNCMGHSEFLSVMWISSNPDDELAAALSSFYSKVVWATSDPLASGSFNRELVGVDESHNQMFVRFFSLQPSQNKN